MKKYISIAISTAAVFTVLFGAGACRNGSSAEPATSEDSIAYIVGMNVGLNLKQMDPDLNIDMVVTAIRDVYEGSPKMTMDEARAYYLRHMNYSDYEAFKLYEERFLADLVKNNRSYARTRSGVTYKVSQSGDQQTLAANNRDTVVIRYRLSLQDGTTVESSFDRADTTRIALSDLVKGVQETMKMVGAGGHFDAWIPSDLAYGANGNEELGIAPNSTLLYEVDVLEVLPYRRK